MNLLHVPGISDCVFAEASLKFHGLSSDVAGAQGFTILSSCHSLEALLAVPRPH